MIFVRMLVTVRLACHIGFDVSVYHEMTEITPVTLGWMIGDMVTPGVQ